MSQERRTTMSSIAGELVTERLVADDGGRQVTVYVPPAPFWREELPLMVAWAFGRA
jgi:hypothetical protein